VLARECSKRAAQYRPRRFDEARIRCASEVALLQLPRRKPVRLGWKSGKMRIDDRRAMRPREHRSNRIGAEVARLVGGSDFMRVALADYADLKTLGRVRLQLLDATARNVGGVVQPRNAVVAARAINLEGGNLFIARDDHRGLARKGLEL
jgi:hypothetical protein